MAILTADQIRKHGSDELPTETVDIPEWGGQVRVQGMTGRQRDRFEAGLLERRGRVDVPNVDNIRAKVVAACLVDEDGTRLFNDPDADELGDYPAAIIERIYKVAARLSGIGDDDIDELQAKITADPTTGSPSSSPAPSDAPPAPNSSHAATPTG